MALRRLDLRGFSGDRRELTALLPRPVDEQDRSSEAVASIIAEVRGGGDEALRALTARFDRTEIEALRVPADEIRAALDRVPAPLQEALDVAHDRILAYHAHEAAEVPGVDEIILCVPPGPDGRIDDATLAAAAVAGVTEVYRVGGAQAIAAMAYGTESIGAVDVIVGPGNRYVAEAKRQVSGVVGVASATYR